MRRKNQKPIGYYVSRKALKTQKMTRGSRKEGQEEQIHENVSVLVFLTNGQLKRDIVDNTHNPGQ